MPLYIESDLIRSAQTQGGAALERVLELVWPQAYRIAASILRDRGLAEDACIAIARGLPALHDTGAFKAWSYTIVVNRANALFRLPIAQRGALVLHYYAGLNSREIAESTGLPRSTIRFHLMLARRTLRALLSNTPPNCVMPSHPEVRSHVR